MIWKKNEVKLVLGFDDVVLHSVFLTKTWSWIIVRDIDTHYSNMKYAWRYQHHSEGIMFREQKNGDLQAKYWMTYWPRHIIRFWWSCHSAFMFGLVRWTHHLFIWYFFTHKYASRLINIFGFYSVYLHKYEPILLSSFYSHRIYHYGQQRAINFLMRYITRGRKDNIQFHIFRNL